jgi:F0F1-type ATP synthase membrane subunit b/b'
MIKNYYVRVFIAYVVFIVVGFVLFGSPMLSKEYMKEHGKDHARYLEIIKTDAFKAYEERPELHPLPAKLEEDAKFVEHYREQPAFEHEERRIWWYIEFSKVLNTVIFILLLKGLVGKPLLNFLDAQIQAIRSSLAEAEKARAEAAQLKVAAQAKMDTWTKTEARVLENSEATIAAQLAKIHEESEYAKALMIKQTEDRKQAELHAAARTIKTELVTESIRVLEERYRTEQTLEKLETNVERFTALMERLS